MTPEEEAWMAPSWEQVAAAAPVVTRRRYGGGYSVVVSRGLMETSTWVFTKRGAARWARRVLRDWALQERPVDITSEVQP